MNRFEYPVKVSHSAEGGVVVTCRDLPELITQGSHLDDALLEASDAMDELFAAYMIDGMTFPLPSKLRRGEYLACPPAETMAKAATYVAMKEST
jgi:antitoxin HicB